MGERSDGRLRTPRRLAVRRRPAPPALPFAGVPEELQRPGRGAARRRARPPSPTTSSSPSPTGTAAPSPCAASRRPPRWAMACAVVLVVIETVDGLRPARSSPARPSTTASCPATAALLSHRRPLRAARRARHRAVRRPHRLDRPGRRVAARVAARPGLHPLPAAVARASSPTRRRGVLMTRMTSDLDALTALFQEGLVNMFVQGLTLAIVTARAVRGEPDAGRRAVPRRGAGDAGADPVVPQGAPTSRSSTCATASPT